MTSFGDQLIAGFCGQPHNWAGHVEPALPVVRSDSAPVQSTATPTQRNNANDCTPHATRNAARRATPPKTVVGSHATPNQFDEHALKLLEHFNEAFPDGVTLSARDCRRIYEELCGVLWRVTPLQWTGVAGRLRKLAGMTKAYRWRNGRRIVVHQFPGEMSGQPERRAAIADAGR